MTLRERHRARTFHKIHEAAWELTRRGGYGATTVEAIADRAGVSRRTFSNCFPSKEDAVLGLTPVHTTQADVERHQNPANGDEFSRTARFFLGILRHSSSFSATGKKRKELLAANPELP